MNEQGKVSLPYQLPLDYAQNPRKPAGRANYGGQDCLYCATRKSTALAESRAAGDTSVSELGTIVELRLANLEVRGPTDAELTTTAEEVLRYLTYRLAEPVEQMAFNERYLATQMIAQLCRVEQFDGISYTSVADGAGKNIALFDPNVVRFRRSELIGSR
jgi:hypothetical protein